LSKKVDQNVAPTFSKSIYVFAISFAEPFLKLEDTLAPPFPKVD